MSDAGESAAGRAGPLVVAVAIANPELCARVLATLAGEPDIEVVAGAEAESADLVVSDSPAHAFGPAPLLLLAEDGSAGAAVSSISPGSGRRRLRTAMFAVAAGLTVTDRPPARAERIGTVEPSLAPPSLATPLSAREREVLALLAEGAPNKVIARRLDISVHTAKFHVASILEKLDATGRTDAVAHAVRLGLVLL